MKILFDFLPLLSFFGTYKLAKANASAAASLATEHLGMLVSGGVVGAKEAPIVLATAVIIVTTLLQVAYLLARRKKVDTMLWVGCGLAIVFGGATIWFHDPTFIKWKFSILNWAFAFALLAGPALFGTNLLQKMMGAQVRLPAPVWQRMNLAWIAFFVVMGLLNLYFAYNFPESLWLDIKIYGGFLMTFLFVVAQVLYMQKHLLPDEADAQSPGNNPVV